MTRRKRKSRSYTDGFKPYRCFKCGRRGSRDFVPAPWESRYYPMIMFCRWEVACNRRYWANAEAKQAEEARQRAEAAAAGIAAAEPVDLDTEPSWNEPQEAERGAQIPLW